jgi:hypothetical protein
MITQALLLEYCIALLWLIGAGFLAIILVIIVKAILAMAQDSKDK